MKKVVLFLLTFVLLPSLIYAGIPISEVITEPVKKEIIHKEKAVIKKQKKLNFFQRKILKRIIKKKSADETSADESPIFNALAITSAILSLTSLIAAAFAFSLAFLYVGIGLGAIAIALGIIGLVKKESLKGLGLTGIILGGITFFVSSFVAIIANSLQ